jgi:hypothetical protein
LDANESAFFRRQLEYIKRQTYDTKFKALKATGLIPVSMEASAGADTITFRRFTNIGFAKIIADYAHDFPRADVYGEEETIRVRSLGSSYGYNIQEIRRAQMAGVDLNGRRAMSARRAVDQLINNLAWSGDTDFNIQGLIDYPGITEYTVPNGAGGDEEWDTKTPDEIVADLSGIVTAIVDSTNGVEAPDTILLPIEQYELIANTRMTGDSSRTIMQFFLENNPHISVIDWVTELAGAGAAGADRMIAYNRDPQNLTLEIPVPFEQLEEDKDGMEYVIPVHARFGGVIVYYPLSVAFGDDI